MTDAFYRYFNCHIRHVLVLIFLFAKFGIIGIIISSSKISWAVLLSTWTKIFMELLTESQKYELKNIENMENI